MPETQTSIAERECLSRNASNRKIAAEIGVWHGVTTCRIAESLAPEGVLYAVDSYVPGRLGLSFPFAVARRNTRKWSHKIEFIRTTSELAAKQFRTTLRNVDFLFIDGNHSYEGLRADWESWAPLIASGGLVALHDSRSTASRNLETVGSCVFTKQVISHDPRFKFVEAVDSLSVFRRTDI